MAEDVNLAGPNRNRTAMILAAATVLAIGVAVGGPFLKSVLEAPANRSALCANQLHTLQIALLSYHDTYGTFPPAYVADADGQPMHSWRVLVLPFLGEDEVYQAYDFSEPWNGPRNRRLADKLSYAHFHCPAAGDDAQIANYLGVVGPEAGFVGAAPHILWDIRDGSRNTIAVVEVRDSDVNWMEPRDLPFEDAARGIDVSGGIAADHPGGPNAAYWDGHIDHLPHNKQQLRALLTARGGEEIAYPDEGLGEE